jgi:hypothetical protein
MKVLYVGDLRQRTTCWARFNALRKIEPNIEFLDWDQYFQDLPRHRRVLEFRTFLGPRLRKLNRDLITLAKSFRPDVVWIDKGICLSSDTLRSLKTEGSFLVGYNTDSLRHKSWSVRWLHWLMNRAIHEHDVYFTTNIHDYDLLRPRSRPRCELTFLGYDH